MNALGSTIGEAVASLRSHPLRSILTALTVTFGTAVLMVLVSYGTAAPDATAEVLRQMGSTQIKVSARWGGGGMGSTRRQRPIQIRYDDLPQIREACPSIGSMAPGYRPGMGGPVFGPERSWPWGTMAGVGVDYLNVADLLLVDGRWFTEEEELDRAEVAVLNLPLSEGLFPRGDAVGNWIETSGRRFEIVGVMFDAAAFAYSFYVPYTAALGLGEKSGRYVDFLSVKPLRHALTREAVTEVRQALASLYSFDPDDEKALRIEQQAEFIEQVDAVSTGLQGVVLAIALVALVLGCLGAANVVGITVAERRAEIGLRKALGATPARIRAEVLTESLLLCSAGGGVGVLLGGLAALALGPLKLNMTVELVPRADFVVLGIGFAVLVLVGAVAGMPAANRAAELDPAVTLREG